MERIVRLYRQVQLALVARQTRYIAILIGKQRDRKKERKKERDKETQRVNRGYSWMGLCQNIVHKN